MGKKLRLRDPKTGRVEIIDEDECFFLDYNNLVKRGRLGRQEQYYKYFCEHPEEIEDQKLFSELEEEFGDERE